MKWTLVLALVLAFPALPQEEMSSRDKIRQARDSGKRGPEAIPQLEPLLRDADVEVRREAVRAVVSIGTQHSLDPLVAACGDNDSEIQIFATDGLVNFYLPGYVETGLSGTIRRAGDMITARWRSDESREVVDPDVPVRPEIITALGRVTTGGSSMASRANAARAVGILRGNAALPDLLEALRSKDDRLIFESLIAIQKLRDPAAGPRVTFLLRDLEEKVQRAAIETVGLMRTPEAVPDLELVLGDTRSKNVRREAMFALGRIATPDLRELFLRYLNDRDNDLRAAAAEGLGRIGQTGDLPLVRRSFEEERRNGPRLAFAFASVALGDTAMTEFAPLRYLVNSLTQRAWRDVAIPYLSELSVKQPVRAALYTALPAGTRDEKTGIAYALSATAAPDAVEPLEALMRDPDPVIGTEAVRALRILRSRIR
ncbi:MAG: HEAT repeat domain-containing protein [Bryobacteraceae bacterium]|nr:HEAT repeat domain-containing protein [Solibacteraceae bacterium]MCL4843526.1 HEAT repeat domain-containing protein [Bryobacteraceae bacterium]MCO5353280.1 HEAT repeat domain-containing protein [Bryobacteraceae bacterium]